MPTGQDLGQYKSVMREENVPVVGRAAVIAAAPADLEPNLASGRVFWNVWKVFMVGTSILRSRHFNL